MSNFDLVIIGGGAAGIFAAISANKANPKQSILIIEQSFSLGRKILVSGAGRCNLTNINLKDDFENHYYSDTPEILENVFGQFGYQSLINLFDDFGIKTYIEQKTNIGKVFPVTDSAKNILKIFEDEINIRGIKIQLNTTVTSIEHTRLSFTLKTNLQDVIVARKIVIAVGGMTYPALGSNGSLYNEIVRTGHSIIKCVPAAVPLTSKDKLIHLLQGTKLEMTVKSIIDGREIKSNTNDVLFTMYGLSGSAILNLSREISVHINRNGGQNCELILNFLPEFNYHTFKSFLDETSINHPKFTIERTLLGLLNTKIVSSIFQIAEIPAEKLIRDLSENQLARLIEMLINFRVKVNGTRGWNEAEFTAGGIPASEINSKTLESTKVKNLYFCGEIINCDGDIGGYNLSWAFCSGFVAGMTQ